MPTETTCECGAVSNDDECQYPCHAGEQNHTKPDYEQLTIF